MRCAARVTEAPVDARLSAVRPELASRAKQSAAPNAARTPGFRNPCPQFIAIGLKPQVLHDDSLRNLSAN